MGAEMDATEAAELSAQPMVMPGRSMAIVYGTETGNSEDIARELGDMAERLHFQTTVDEMNSFSLVCLEAVLCLIARTNWWLERSSAIYSGHIRLFNHWARGHTRQRHGTMEEYIEKETPPWLSEHYEVYYLWPWRQFLSKVSGTSLEMAT
jgi:hypothetical protein